MIESLTGQGFSEREACRVVGANRSSYAYWRKRPPHLRSVFEVMRVPPTP